MPGRCERFKHFRTLILTAVACKQAAAKIFFTPKRSKNAKNPQKSMSYDSRFRFLAASGGGLPTVGGRGAWFRSSSSFSLSSVLVSFRLLFYHLIEFPQ